MSNQNSPVRCLIAKAGLDGHDRGAHVVARALREAGYEVIYSGLHNEPSDIVRTAVQEDVDVIGLSILSGAHNTIVPEIIEKLRDYGIYENILFLVGGTIPEADRSFLSKKGVDKIFGPGTETSRIVDFIETDINDNERLTSG